MNRSGPVLSYQASGAIQVSLVFMLAAIEDARTEVNDVAVALQSLLLPKDPGIEPPPIIYFTRQGHRLFDNWPCVCPSINVHEHDGPYSPEGYAMVATVTMQLLELCLENQAAKNFGAAGKMKQNY